MMGCFRKAIQLTSQMQECVAPAKFLCKGWLDRQISVVLGSGAV
jgi:hypothetical protein